MALNYHYIPTFNGNNTKLMMNENFIVQSLTGDYSGGQGVISDVDFLGIFPDPNRSSNQLTPAVDSLGSDFAVYPDAIALDAITESPLIQAIPPTTANPWQTIETFEATGHGGMSDPLLGSVAYHPVGIDGLDSHGQLQSIWQEALQQIEAFLSHSTLNPWLGVGSDAQLRSLLAGEMINLVVTPAALLQANGAFAAETQTIYLADSLLQQSNEAAVSVLLEEIGHWVDAQVNTMETSGDEGAIFAALVQGKSLSAAQWAALAVEDDHGWLNWGDQSIAVEYSGPGVFTTTGGTVQVEFLFDGGQASGELGIYSLTGMDAFAPGSAAYKQEAARRALNNGAQGAQMFSDASEGAKFSGQLGEPDQNAGSFAGPKSATLTPGEKFAFIFAPGSRLQTVFNNPNQTALFSVADANPGKFVQFAQLSGDVFAIEDISLSQNSDADFNDIIFKVSGATGSAVALTQVISAQRTWFNLPLTQTILGGFGNTLGFTPIQSAVSSNVAKFKASDDEATIQASGAQQLVIGGQRIYIGTDQVTGINQNPIIASFGSNTWMRGDYEITGADGRGVGLAWTGSELYGVFTIDGTQGTASQDFRRESSDATTPWLRSYGQGGGAKVSVIGRIDLATGALVDAAYLSAILSNGNSNSLVVTDIGTNTAGNVVIQAQSYFAPRRPDGTAMTQVTSSGSPFAYTVELTSDLKRVVSTSAAGWV